MTFDLWLLLLNIISVRFTHVVACSSDLFILVAV